MRSRIFCPVLTFAAASSTERPSIETRAALDQPFQTRSRQAGILRLDATDEKTIEPLAGLGRRNAESEAEIAVILFEIEIDAHVRHAPPGIGLILIYNRGVLISRARRPKRATFRERELAARAQYALSSSAGHSRARS